MHVLIKGVITILLIVLHYHLSTASGDLKTISMDIFAQLGIIIFAILTIIGVIGTMFKMIVLGFTR